MRDVLLVATGEEEDDIDADIEKFDANQNLGIVVHPILQVL